MYNGCQVADAKVIDLNEPSFKVCDLCFYTCFQFSFMVFKALLSDRAFSDNMEKNKGSNFTTAETTALLEGVRIRPFLEVLVALDRVLCQPNLKIKYGLR